MKTNRIKHTIVRLCKKNIDDLEEKIRIALNEMDRMRIPLHLTSTSLSEEIEEQTRRFCQDKNINIDAIPFQSQEIFELL